MAELERRFEVQPVGEGRYGTRFRWCLVGPEMAVQFLLRIGRDGELQPWDLGMHWRFDPGFATQMDECDVLGVPCWYDGSSLNAEPVLDRLCREGLDGLWAELEDYYESQWQYVLEDLGQTQAGAVKAKAPQP